MRQRRGADGVLFDQLRYCLCGPVVHHALVIALQEAAHHVRSHSAEANHSELHGLALPGEADGSSDREAATPAIRASRTRQDDVRGIRRIL
jgi:hypothetical protein